MTASDLCIAVPSPPLFFYLLAAFDMFIGHFLEILSYFGFQDTLYPPCLCPTTGHTSQSIVLIILHLLDLLSL